MKKKFPQFKETIILFLTLILFSHGFLAYAIENPVNWYFFVYKELPYHWSFTKHSDRFELALTGNKLTFQIDSSVVQRNVPASLEVISSDPSVTTSSPRILPLNFTLEQFKAVAIATFVDHSASNNGSVLDLIALLKDEKVILELLLTTYNQVKEIELNRIIQENRVTVQTAKEEEVRQLNQGHKRAFDSLLNIIDIVDDEHRYGGQFEIVDTNGSGILVYRAKRDTLIKGYIPYDTTKMRFYAASIVLKTFNNFIDFIHVDGNVLLKGKEIPVNFYNGDFSIPLKHLYNRKQYLPFTIPYSYDSDSIINSPYLVNVSDLVKLNPYRDNITFMIKDETYKLNRRDSIVPFYRRSIYDYLNVTTFLDFLGVVEKTPNSLIQIEGRMRLPLRLVNARLFTRKRYMLRNVFFPKVDFYLNAAFINGSQTETRVGTIFNQSANSSSLDTLFIDNFDLIRKNNIRTGVELGLLKVEMKTNNLNFYVDYGVHFVRTNFLYTIVNTTTPDEQQRFNVWSTTHGPILRFEYRPDLNLGMDISLATNLSQRLTNSDNDNLRIFEVAGPLNKNLPAQPALLDIVTNKQKTNFKLEFNAYWMNSPRSSNGGLYFRLSNYFNYNFSQLFPQILVGYSTRLSGMIKNITNKIND